nr:unnamed protein product [Callosobruchus analis]
MFYNICVCILFHFVVLSKSEDLNNTLTIHLERQRKLFSILYHVHLPMYSKDVTEIASEWSLEEHKADFTGLLPIEAVFTPFYESHLEEAIALFRLFFYAKDWDTFYKTLAWARTQVNSQMLIYALYLAVDHRKDCKNLVLPPIYEVNPYFFAAGRSLSDVEHKKSKYDESLIDTRSKYDMELMEHDPNKHKYHEKKVENNVNVTNEQALSQIASITGYPYYGNRLFHLYKDVGVNAMYYYFNIRYPLWMSSREFQVHRRRGETFLNFYQQLSGVDIIGRFIKNTELFQFDLVNVFNHTESEKFGDFEAREHHYRPKPDNFTYKIHVRSESAVELCFKHRMDMFNLDKFTYRLKEGVNTIERNITESPYFKTDERSFSDMYHEILNALAGNITYKADTFDPASTYAWPLRFFVAAFQENEADDGPLPMLYPFDRPIKNEKMFMKVPNFYSHTISVEPDGCSGFLDRPKCTTNSDRSL